MADAAPADKAPVATGPVRIKGGMTTSKVSGNGWWFRKQGLLDLITSKAEAPYVIDHGMDLAAIAGQIQQVSLREEGTVDVPIIYGDSKGKTKKWSYATIGHESVLSPENPAFETAVGYIVATAKAGKVPQESISFQIGGITYDQETDQVIFEPPFRLVHHSAVSRGAFGPEVGIGVTSIEMSAGAPVSFESAGLASYSAPVHIPNLPEMVAAFSTANSANAPALAALARVGLAAHFAAGVPMPKATGGDSNTASPPSGEQGEQPKDHIDMADKNDPPAGTQPPAAPSGADLEAAIKKEVDARFEAEKAQRQVSLDAEKRKHLVENYGAREGFVAKLSGEALADYETELRNNQSQGLGFRQRTPSPTDPAVAAAKASAEERKSWLKEMSTQGVKA